MFKYFHIIKFLMTHDLTELKEYWQSEILRGKNFKWRRLVRFYFKEIKLGYRYLVWWRLANFIFINGTKSQIKAAHSLQLILISKFNTEICLGAKIGKNFFIDHCNSIVITSEIIIGDNFNIRQNTTIGLKTIPHSTHDNRVAEKYLIKIGNNVFIGANSTILSDTLIIGNHVIIGGMSFINKDIPDNCTVYTEKSNIIKIRPN